MITNPLRDSLKPNSLPHFFCPGCGAAQVMNYFVRAMDELQIPMSSIMGIGGVGCTARIPVYLKLDAMHGIHGRTLAWATGIKLMQPDLKVVIFAGDGDAAAIGGNHLIQAARRNLDVTMIVVNNLNYGMTGGQVAPTTYSTLRTTTTPYGNPEPAFDLVKLVEAAGATFVSRWSTNKPHQSIRAIKKAIQHKGFSFVEIVSQCTTGFGRKAISSGSPTKLLDWIKERSISIADAEKMNEQELAGKFVLGDFVEKSAPIFTGSSTFPVEDAA
ncbi:MAG: thiamine pyrophosphate-dependent enzyme [Anaerolineaceae bacterium]|nr:thiamine pyrophosphate-dependent enzyme [Anaerolineaceae bacterium]